MPEPTDLTDLAYLAAWPVYGDGGAAQRERFVAELRRLTAWHQQTCAPYRRIIQRFGGTHTFDQLEDAPFLPVRLFKHEMLVSVPPSEIVKTMTSSGTSGQSVSQILLDKSTAALQVKVLSRIMGQWIGPRRLPMLVIDARATVADRLRFSARTAGILGFSMFGHDVEYALDDDMRLNLERVRAFLDRHQGTNVLVFGFTAIVWRHLVRALESMGESLSLPAGTLLHGGGWKQMLAQAVDAEEFRRRLLTVTKIDRVHNYYGMVEQTGSIFMECESGHMHASAWSEVVVRDPIDFRPLAAGERGLIQLFSVLPRSYPGHSILTEDEGTVLGRNDCRCGRKGTYFRVFGRIQDAEARGCSDTYTR